MWRIAALVLIFCAGCEATDFYQATTHQWFATPPASPTVATDGAAK